MISFDTEDNSSGKITLCSFFDGKKATVFNIQDYINIEIKDFDKIEYNDILQMKIDIIDFIFSSKENLFIAHNLEYDLVNIFYPESLDNLELFYKGRLLFAYLRKTKKKFLDSFNFSFTNLKTLGNIVGSKKIDVGMDFFNIEYNIQDSKIPYLYMQNFDNMLDKEFNLKKKNTLAGTCQHVYLKRFAKHNLLGQNLHEDIIKAYYGGRTEIFIWGEILDKYIFEIDINSSYPTSMKFNQFPVSDYVITEHPISEFWVAEIYLEIKEEIKFPIIPFRKEKLLFPVGEFTTFVTSAEFEKAMEEGQIKNYRFIKTYNFKETDYIFNQYIDYCYEKRLEAKKKNDDFMSNFYKLMMNSVYGRFALKGSLEVLKNKDDLKSYKDLFEKFNIGLTEKFVDENKKNFAIPAFVTAYSRILLYNMIKEVEKLGAEIIYTDTDSVYFFFNKKIDLQNTIQNLYKKLNIGKKLGQYSLIVYKRGCFYNAKSYMLTNFYEALKTKCKGIPQAFREKFLKTGSVKYKRPMKLRASLRGVQGIEANTWYELKVEQKNKYSKRKIIYSKNKTWYKTEPIKLTRE